MRRQFVQTVEQVLAEDERLIVLLGDIGVFGFRRAFEKHPKRIYNIGILEQSTVGLSAGLAMSGFIPLFHTIAPFLVERAYEQLKVDFCYQKLGGNFVTVGASYDYAGLGCTHHAPGDVSVLSALPNMEIVVPGSSSEFDKLFRESYANGNPTYYRLSERECKTGPDCEFGRGVCLRSGNRGTIIAVGPMLDAVLAATANLDVTILYYSTITPFDVQLLRANARSETVIIVEPFYEGTLVRHVAQTLSDRPVRIHSIGVPNRFLTHYGSTEDHDVDNGLTPDHIHARLEAWLES